MDSNHIRKHHPDQEKHLKRRRDRNPPRSRDNNPELPKEWVDDPDDLVENADYDETELCSAEDQDELFEGFHIPQDELGDIETTSQNLEIEDEQDSDIEISRRFPTKYKAEQLFSEERSPGFNHLYPFLNARDYKLARFFTESKVPKNTYQPILSRRLVISPRRRQ